MAEAELPREQVDTSMPAQGGRLIAVPPGADLQAALDSARFGDIIELQAGASYVGEFTPPRLSGSGWVVVRSSAWQSLPEGQRVSPAHAHLMPKLVSPGYSLRALNAQNGAHHFRFVGLEFKPIDDTADVRNLVWLSDTTDGADLSKQPHHIILDRCYIHGTPVSETGRGVMMNGKHLALINSHVSDIKHSWQDSQAVMGATGHGPFLIENNFLEAASENVMFGGTDSPVPGLVPSDITIRRNHLSKPNRWRHDSPEYGGKAWAVKNLLEIKNGRRILIEGNLIENVWKHHQTGVAVLLKATNQYGAATWNTCADVTFRHNIVRSAATAIQLATNEGPQGQPTAGTKRIKIYNNLIYDISRVRYAEGVVEGDFIGTNVLATDVLIDRNTVGDVDMKVMRLADPNHPRFSNLSITNNVFARGNNTGIGLESSVTEGNWAFQNWGTGVSYQNNLMFNAGVDYNGNAVAPKYPAGNFFAPLPRSAVFVDAGGGNYRVRGGQGWPGGLGCDIDTLEAVMGGAAPPPAPPPAPAPPPEPGPLPTPPPTPGPSTGTATFLQIDTSTQGTWRGTYGGDGYHVVGDDASGNTLSHQMTVSGQSPYVWAPDTADGRALQKSRTDGRLAATWYTNNSMTVELAFNDGNAHKVALYCLDWDGGNARTQRVEVLDAGDALLDSRDLWAFSGGQYVVWELSGHVKIRVTNTSGINAVVSGLFFDIAGAPAPTPTPTPGPGAGAVFLGLDPQTQGTWKGTYGGDGYLVVNDSFRSTGYAQISASGQQPYTWDPAPSEARATQKEFGDGRLAASWYTGTTMAIEVRLTDGRAHRAALYFLDWDRNGRAQRVEVWDAASGALLDRRDVSDFAEGKYLVWRLSGQVRITVSKAGGANAVVSGIFFDTPATLNSPLVSNPTESPAAVTSPAPDGPAAAGSIVRRATRRKASTTSPRIFSRRTYRR